MSTTMSTSFDGSRVNEGSRRRVRAARRLSMQLGNACNDIYLREGVVLEGYSSGAGCERGVQGAGKRGARGWVKLVVPLDNRVGVPLLVAEAGDGIHDTSVVGA